MVSEQHVLTSVSGAIARLTLNRPEVGNSLSEDLVKALRAELDILQERAEIKVIILAGAGSRIFCAGHDLNEFAGQEDQEILRQDFAGLTGLMQQIMAQRQIVIAQIEGVATAAGCELVAACDLALASARARFAVPGVNIGFWCHTPQVQLARTIGRKQAMMMLTTGRMFPAAHALAIGLINEVHVPEQLEEAVTSLALEIASKAASVLKLGKESFAAQTGKSVDDAYALARSNALANLQHDDAKEGIAAFLEKRQPRWQ
jgi:enoyl-CoA hydratase/carnithine racemase